MKNQNEKYAVVTGAGGGMGNAVSKALADDGYVIFAMDLCPPQATDKIIPITVDITDEESINCALRTVSNYTQKLDAVLHFAGIYMLDSLVEMSEEKMMRAYNVNLFGAMRVNRIFLPLLSKGSRIVIATSELAPLDPLPFTGIYAITKSALDKYAYSLRMELSLLGISVTVIRPGAVNTSMLGVSMRELNRFVENTENYSCNAKRFKRIVESVEARHVPAERVAKIAKDVLRKKKPPLVRSINRNPLLLLLNVLPDRLATFIIKMILTK